MIVDSNWFDLNRVSVAKDVAAVVVVILIVFLSLPVSVVGDESLVDYFFSDRKTVVVTVDNSCVALGLPCVVRLNDASELTVTMPAQVNILESFDVLASMAGVGAERMTIRFEGLDHSHGLLPQSMRQLKPQSFDVEGLLSYCGYPRMDWVAVVSVYTDRIIYEAAFQFESFDARSGLAPGVGLVLSEQ